MQIWSGRRVRGGFPFIPDVTGVNLWGRIHSLYRPPPVESNDTAIISSMVMQLFYKRTGGCNVARSTGERDVDSPDESNAMLGEVLVILGP